MKIEGCIFDLDGTLLDTMPLWGSVGYDYLISLGKTPKDDFFKRLRTMTMQDTPKYFISEYGINKTPIEIRNGINDLMEINYKTKSKPKANIIEFLENMKSQNVKMCVASATDTYLIKEALKINNMESYFDGIFSCKDVGFNKNFPNIYDCVLKHIGTNKEYTYIFEDALHAITTAKKADYKVVGIYDDASKDQLNEIKTLSDIFITSYDELKDIFNK